MSPRLKPSGITAALVPALLVLFLSLSCYKGHGLSPMADESGGFSGIKGRVTFVGDWPDSTREVRVAVLKQYPKDIVSPDSMLGFVITNLAAWSDTIPRFAGQADYRIPLEPGSYEWVLVVWFPDVPLYLLGVKELGAYYRNPGRQTVPTRVDVLTGVFVEGLDIEANFSHVDDSRPFFKSSAPSPALVGRIAALAGPPSGLHGRPGAAAPRVPNREGRK